MRLNIVNSVMFYLWRMWEEVLLRSRKEWGKMVVIILIWWDCGFEVSLEVCGYCDFFRGFFILYLGGWCLSFWWGLWFMVFFDVNVRWWLLLVVIGRFMFWMVCFVFLLNFVWSFGMEWCGNFGVGNYSFFGG